MSFLQAIVTIGNGSFFFGISQWLKKGNLKQEAERISLKIIDQQYRRIVEERGKYIPRGFDIESKLFFKATEKNLKIKWFYHPALILMGIKSKVDEAERLPSKDKILKKLDAEIQKYFKDTDPEKLYFKVFSVEGLSMLQSPTKFVLQTIATSLMGASIIHILILSLIHI